MDEVQRFNNLKDEIAELSNQKIRGEERYNNLKKQLEKLLKEISEKGFDPQKLSDIREQKEKEFKEQLEEIEDLVKKAQEKMNEIEV